ncbi:methionyl-tRNA formyltransferase [Chitinimonas sp. PSY-7]|uniref:formyltransferase family protein n=1 Tax=Chitinimonas sp. PSY-7 TaxID=3459088 RepID=UPI0040401B0D
MDLIVIKFYLTGKKGYFTLLGALTHRNDGISIHVIVGRDRNVADDYSENIVALCIENEVGYSVYPSETNIPYNYVIAAGWQRMIHNVSDSQLIIFHDSLLPRYRGFAPLVNALLNKEKYLGVTALVGASEYDMGDIYCQESISVEYPVLISDMIDMVSELYTSLIKAVIDKIITNALIPYQQSHIDATYSLWRDEEDYRIQWSDKATDIEHFIRCVGFPYLGASTIADGELLRILSATIVPDVYIENRTPGKTIFVTAEGKPIVVCGEGLLQLDIITDNTGAVFKMKKFRLRFK